MATRDELTTAIQVLINEARRIGARFTEEEWAREGDEGGWTTKQVLAHVAGVGSMVVPFVTAVSSAPPGANAGQGFDVDAMNAQIVAQRADKTPAELVAEVESSYGAVIEFVRGAADDLLDRRIEFADFQGLPVSDLMVQIVALHGIAHIYHAANRV